MKKIKNDGTYYLNPYLGGVILGTFLFLAFYIPAGDLEPVEPLKTVLLPA